MKDDTNYYIFMEYCANGELFRLVANHGPLTEAHSRFIIGEILDALGYCHAHGIAHRDLKPENLLLSATGHVKLTDFGLSKYVGQSGLCETSCGTPAYASPECLAGGQYNGMISDIWSVGVVLFVLLTGRLPWTQTNQTQLYAQIKAGDYRIPTTLTPQCKDFLSRLLAVDPVRRITIEAANRHDWMTIAPRPRCRRDAVPQPFVGVKKADRMFENDDALELLELAREADANRSMQIIAFGSLTRALAQGKVSCPMRKGKVCPLPRPGLRRTAATAMASAPRSNGRVGPPRRSSVIPVKGSSGIAHSGPKPAPTRRRTGSVSQVISKLGASPLVKWPQTSLP
jgi:serine/threonine protein kinase